MVTYQFQLINLNNGNSDVFKQLESNRSSPGQPCCVFVPTPSNKATSPINVHTQFHIAGSATFKHLRTPRPRVHPGLQRCLVFACGFAVPDIIVC